jgi:hypothetical protein
MNGNSPFSSTSGSGPVRTAHCGTNSKMIAEVARLYLQPGDLVADVTYGRGRFWKHTDTTSITLLCSDVGANVSTADFAESLAGLACDFRRLPYREGALDVVVLDPPYAHNPGTKISSTPVYAAANQRYRGSATVAGFYNADIMNMYRQGMTEAYRVLKPDGGQLWVKCKDEVEREVQRWSHIAIYQIALEIGFCARDLFVLMPSSGQQQVDRWRGHVQRHARKTHSYLWVFQRPDVRYGRLLAQSPPSRATAKAPPQRTR